MSAPYNVKQALLAAYRHLLTPLVRVLLRNGISYLEFAEVARQVFVDVAGRDFTLPKRKISLSRIAIMTGLSRKEVARLAREGRSKKALSSSIFNRVTRVLQGWYTDPDFTGPYGVPLDLQFDEAARKVSFSELVRRYSGDMPARAMLDELLRVGAARIEGESGLIRVLSRSYIPEKLDAENVRHFGSQIRCFVDTLDFNMRKAAPGRGRFERIVFADEGLTPEDVDEFDAFLRERGQQLLIELDDWLAARPRPKKGEPAVHTGVGVYHYIRSEEAEKALAKMLEEGELNEGEENG
jgi:hypothetical protein